MSYYFEDGEMFEMNGKNYMTVVYDTHFPCCDSCDSCDIRGDDCFKFNCRSDERLDKKYAYFVDIEKVPKKKVQDEQSIDGNVDYREEYNNLKEKYDALIAKMSKTEIKENTEVDVLNDIIIPELEKYFDFELVYKMMTAAGWTYSFEPVTLDEIKRCAFDNVKTAYEKHCTVECGGFKAEFILARDAAIAFGYKDDELEEKAVYDTVKLSFVGEEWETSFCKEEDE